jgi:hypothetical protein
MDYGMVWPFYLLAMGDIIVSGGSTALAVLNNTIRIDMVMNGTASRILFNRFLRAK